MTGPRPRPSASPMTEAEMIQRYRDGDTVDAITTIARRRNGLSKHDVRMILFGSTPERAS